LGLVVAQPNPTLLGPTGHQDPTMLFLFGSVLGLACKPDPTMLCPFAKLNPVALGR